MGRKDIIVGVDDTDNLESRGTGFRVREMTQQVQQLGLAEIRMITRHQLLVDPRIPYTSHNSSAAMVGTTGDKDTLIRFCQEYLTKNSAPGSDAGLCLAGWEDTCVAVMNWGRRAKTEILTMEEAFRLADSRSIHLSGLTGSRTGIIGALAAVGLRKEGCDGRVLWMPGMRELTGVVTVEQLIRQFHLDQVMDINGEVVSLQSRINLGDWFRPVMKDRKCILFVEETDHESYQYRVAAKDYIKSNSQ
ncbi:MAG: hypothetical protein NTU44_17900 [Bacteroidetes bacterium]|nr:hypothetical protein [Bacteroidota bacterium]